LRLIAPNLSAAHAFTTRQGGVSEAPYDSLNLGLSTGDRSENVLENRRRALALIGGELERVALLHQVHSARVVVAEAGLRDRRADGLLTGESGIPLAVSGADCYPVLVEDPRQGCVGAAHAGWRGVAAGIGGALIEAFRDRFGSRAEELRVAIGPGISGRNYQVGEEVVARLSAAGFPLDSCGTPEDQVAGRERKWRLDLVAALIWQLEHAGVDPGGVWVAGRCTYGEPAVFFSHRRDGPRTGRQWGMIVG
jgi:YfiH family protein